MAGHLPPCYGDRQRRTAAKLRNSAASDRLRLHRHLRCGGPAGVGLWSSAARTVRALLPNRGRLLRVPRAHHVVVWANGLSTPKELVPNTPEASGRGLRLSARLRGQLAAVTIPAAGANSR